MKYVAIGFAVVVGLLALSWVTQGNDWFMYKFWAPKYEDVRRETYEHTKSYRQGSAQRLGTLCTQVAAADDGHKSMLNDVISHEFVEWNMDDVPEHLQACLRSARAN
jgi:hypothetical protein